MCQIFSDNVTQTSKPPQKTQHQETKRTTKDKASAGATKKVKASADHSCSDGKQQDAGTTSGKIKSNLKQEKLPRLNNLNSWLKKRLQNMQVDAIHKQNKKNSAKDRSFQPLTVEHDSAKDISQKHTSQTSTSPSSVSTKLYTMHSQAFTPQPAASFSSTNYTQSQNTNSHQHAFPTQPGYPNEVWTLSYTFNPDNTF
ncbi:hypothetical protein DPMN_111730 [Dreissena polymorpha]|uniref:Uncharacterized protein n=1 Tax=Dreissena polymorpha TaxID=45954 RepID=A0A9D4QQ21_DREPO|nr:hypothetical protein DPMN_111730 [Dreissena polymorpha]